MDLKTLFEMQHKLDTRILENLSTKMVEIGNDVVFPEDLRVERTLALIVETSEFANSARDFKYWSDKESESKDRLLDEYVDILHFWLSVGLAYGFNHYDVEEAYKKKNAVNFQRQADGY